MNLFEMSLAGGAMVLAVVLARALLLNKLPKATFVVLWLLVAARLLVPVAIPSPLSVASLLSSDLGGIVAPEAPHPTDTVSVSDTPLTTSGSTVSDTDRPLPTVPLMPGSRDLAAPAASPAPAPTAASEPARDPGIAWDAVIPAVWAVGAVVCAGVFGVIYLRCRREFQTSLPVDNEQADTWLAAHRAQLRRPLSLRQSDRVATPLTYGVFKPVILVPATCDWQAREQVRFMLAHELVHVRRFDAVTKIVFVACVCVHWFNPLVWALYVLANRDLELSCDERVVRSCGTGSRASYARTLIAMEETKSGLAPLYSGFSKTATEERIVAIMHIKKSSIVALAASASLVVGIPAALATSAVPHTLPVVPDTPVDAQASVAPLQEAPSTARSAFDTSAWNKVVSSTYYSPADWALVEALNVPGVEDLTVEEFTALALSVADTPEKRDTLALFMDDADISAQVSTNGAAHFVAHVMAPVLRESSRFPTARLASGGSDAHWSAAYTLVEADAVATDDGSVTPLAGALGKAGYTGEILCYMINVHVLDASTTTVGAYVQAIEDTQRALDSLIDWDLMPTWDHDAGEKLTVALDDIARAESSDNLLVELSWFFIEDEDGTMTVANAGSGLQGTVGYAADASGAPVAVSVSDVVYDDDNTSFTTALLDSYAPLGLTYSLSLTSDAHALSMEFAGSPVRSVFDEHHGVWIANSMNEFRYGDAGIDLVAVYDGDRVTGLRLASDAEQEGLDTRRAELTTAEVVLEVPAEATAKTAYTGTAEGLREIRASYEPFGLVYDAAADTYRYQGEPVRFLFDGYIIEENADGTAGSYFTTNDYYNADGTVDVYVMREVERNADGSVNPVGDVIGVYQFSRDQKALVDELIVGYLMPRAEMQTAVAEGDSTTPVNGLTLAERLEPFVQFGLTYRDGNLYYHGKPANALVCQTDGGVFSYSSVDQQADGIFLRAVYDAAGRPTGLKEFDPSAVFTEQ